MTMNQYHGPDDGMRFVRSIDRRGHRFVVQENPNIIAEVIVAKRQRQLNIERYS